MHIHWQKVRWICRISSIIPEPLPRTQPECIQSWRRSWRNRFLSSYLHRPVFREFSIRVLEPSCSTTGAPRHRHSTRTHRPRSSSPRLHESQESVEPKSACIKSLRCCDSTSYQLAFDRNARHNHIWICNDDCYHFYMYRDNARTSCECCCTASTICRYVTSSQGPACFIV